jgi:3-methyladenine DNA glycosylase AlkD
MYDIINSIRREIKEKADENTRISGERFFKEEVKIYGLKSAVTEQIAKNYYKTIPDKSKDVVFDLCEDLWRSGYLEESGIACIWSFNVHRQYKSGDIKVFERWVDKYVKNWAACDTLCNHSVGTLAEMYPDKIADLKRWAKSKNLWMRRASAVSLIMPARKGLFIDDIFEIAEILLMDEEDMVRKGYGWMLKAASQAYQQKVFGFVMKHKAVMPRTALRYAIEKMPKDLKAAAMTK